MVQDGHGNVVVEGRHLLALRKEQLRELLCQVYRSVGKSYCRGTIIQLHHFTKGKAVLIDLFAIWQRPLGGWGQAIQKPKQQRVMGEHQKHHQLVLLKGFRLSLQVPVNSIFLFNLLCKLGNLLFGEVLLAKHLTRLILFDCQLE